MTRIAIIGINGAIPRTFWDKTSRWSAYTKNQIPHKTLKNKTPIETLFLNKSIQEEQKNLRPFEQLVSCYR